MLDGDAGEQPGLVLAADQQRREPLRELEVVLRVEGLVRSEAAVLVESLEAVLAHRLEQVIARSGFAGVHDEQRLVHQRRDAIQDVFGLERIADTDGFRRLEREAAGEDGEPAEQRLLAVLEEPVAPVHRAAKRSLSR